MGELPDRIDVIDRRYPGFRNRMRGYAFFIDQNMPEMLSESTALSVYLAYGWHPPDNQDPAAEVYEKNSLGIAHEVCDALRAEGFDVDWNGDFTRKIGVSLNWRRRQMLDQPAEAGEHPACARLPVRRELPITDWPMA